MPDNRISAADAIKQFSQNTGANVGDVMAGMGMYTNAENYLTPDGQQLLYGSTFTYNGSDVSYDSIMSRDQYSQWLSSGLLIDQNTPVNNLPTQSPSPYSDYRVTLHTEAIIVNGSGSSTPASGTPAPATPAPAAGSQPAQTVRYTYSVDPSGNVSYRDSNGRRVSVVEVRQKDPNTFNEAQRFLNSRR